MSRGTRWLAGPSRDRRRTCQALRCIGGKAVHERCRCRDRDRPQGRHRLVPPVRRCRSGPPALPRMPRIVKGRGRTCVELDGALLPGEPGGIVLFRAFTFALLSLLDLFAEVVSARGGAAAVDAMGLAAGDGIHVAVEAIHRFGVAASGAPLVPEGEQPFSLLCLRVDGLTLGLVKIATAALAPSMSSVGGVGLSVKLVQRLEFSAVPTLLVHLESRGRQTRIRD